VLKSVRATVVVAIVLCLALSGGVALADPPDPDTIEDSKITSDGNWRLHITLSGVNITSVPNMAATAFTREAYVSATAQVQVEALRPEEAIAPGAGVTSRSVSLWLQMGCQAVVGGENLTLSNTSQVGLSGNATNAGAASVTPSAGDNPNPQFQQALSPGTMVAKNLQNKAYPPDKPDPSAKTPPWVTFPWQNDSLTVSLHAWDMKVDSCGGPVSFRFIGEATMSTLRSDDAVDVFSAIVQV
jgi:hypothetical protein